ncbi:Endo/exonuclease/phosphatase domain-containing protein [Aphis craccivora]|uniref:Endo/exonuclease/phosphatase domain-containing protein n=1 Tax=Aphis craccivora TaxID=307492 RepID=A0A6G0WYT0_APHCR|nr:Endo/exonuclease/phosphatase domain-containing protein [Aphis craccivora]
MRFMCVQETHRDQTLNVASISGMKLAAIKHHRKHGSANFTKPNMTIQSVKIYEQTVWATRRTTR